MASHDWELDAQRVAIVNRYATPLAVMLVLLGVVLTQPRAPILQIGFGLLIFGILFNVLSAKVIVDRVSHPGKAEWILKIRLWVNLTINVLLIYFLGGFWPPIWLLLSLTPLATAIYGSRAQTLKSCALVSLLLLGVQWMRGMISPFEWGQQLVYVGYIFLISLLVNQLSSVNREAGRQPGHA